MRFLGGLFILGVILGKPLAYAQDYLPPTFKIDTPAIPSITSDPGYVDQWHLQAIEAEGAWTLIPRNTRPITVAVIDSGIDYLNPDLLLQISMNKIELKSPNQDDDLNGLVDDIIGWNFRENISMPWDDNGHGTMISSLIAAVHNNGFGGKGICPICRILPIRFIGSNGFGDNADAVKAIDYALQTDAKVINLSFGDTHKDLEIIKAIQRAQQKDVLVVIAAGNWGWNNDDHEVFPANLNLSNTITVAATHRTGALWPDSAWGPNGVQVAAPGVEIFGSILRQGWSQGNGTSLATPLVSGLAALLRASNPKLTAAQTKNIIMSTSSKSPLLKDKVKSEGIINAKLALKCAIDRSLSCLKP